MNSASPQPHYPSLSDLSPELQINALQTLACPVIPLVPDGVQLGSGVLVEVDGVSGILTAEHVVFSEEFQRAQGLWTVPHTYSAESVLENTAHFSSTNIRRDLLRVFPETPTCQIGNGEWGPDLAFIRIPRDTNFERSLRAVRINFYSLARDTPARLDRALDSNYSLIAIAGAPVELNRDLSPTPTHMRGILQCPVLLAPSSEYREREGGWDYFDVPVDPELRVHVPHFFNGVSGGAVWRLVNLFEPGAELHELRSSDYVLAGIAFWQGLDNFRVNFLRGHGPRSLYERFLPELRAWLNPA